MLKIFSEYSVKGIQLYRERKKIKDLREPEKFTLEFYF